MQNGVAATVLGMVVVARVEADDDDFRAGALALVDRLSAERGRSPLSDQHVLALTNGSTAVTVAAHDGDELIGWAQVVAGNGAQSVEVVVDARDGAGDDRVALLRAAIEAADAGAGPLDWWVSSPTDADEADAHAAGLAPVRRQLQMRRPLPTEMEVTVTTRPFRPGEDEDAWLAVNNAAFAEHAEQGGWTRPVLAQREAAAWFDPDGFLLHEREGRLAAFCWTKLHRDADPVLGEIYVIAVHPDFQGLGLGRQLTLAGLESIARRGVDIGMLHVDAANEAAIGLYESLGFETHHADVAYRAAERTSGDGR